MSEQMILQVREMSRDRLEGLVLQSMMQLRIKRQESQASENFIGILMGFVIGAIAAVFAFSLGTLFR